MAQSGKRKRSERVYSGFPAIDVSGSEGVYNGAVAMNNGILYGQPNAGSSRVQEGIPKGHAFVLQRQAQIPQEGNGILRR